MTGPGGFARRVTMRFVVIGLLLGVPPATGAAQDAKAAATRERYEALLKE